MGAWRKGLWPRRRGRLGLSRRGPLPRALGRVALGSELLLLLRKLRAQRLLLHGELLARRGRRRLGRGLGIAQPPLQSSLAQCVGGRVRRGR